MPTIVLLFSLTAAFDSCAPTCVVCLPTIETKTKTHTCYGCRVKTVCLPFKPKCDPCASCGRPREVRVLLKRFVKEETPQRACQPVKCP